MTDKVHSGSQSVLNPGSSAPPEEVKPETAAPAPDPMVGKMASLEQQLAASQKMIGQQSGEIKGVRAMRQELDDLKATKAAPQGPTEQEQYQSVMSQITTGDLGLEEGMAQALELKGAMTVNQVMLQLKEQQQKDSTADIQREFLKANPDFNEAVESGALKPYLDASALNDEYTAFHLMKSDQKVAALNEEHAAAVAAAKEEGARVASGAENAGKVLGKTGAAIRPTGEVKKFRNSKDATAAMSDTLAKFRSTSGG